MRKFFIGAMAATILGGSAFAVAVVSPLGIAAAQDETTPPTTAAPDPGNAEAPAKEKERGKGPHILDETLSELAANGTITQDQATAIREALKAKAEAHRAEHPKGTRDGGPGRHGKGHGAIGLQLKAHLEAIAQVIGITPEQLMTELKAGKSLAQIAQDNGVDLQRVTDAIIAKVNAEIDKAVADGKIPAERAAKMKEELAKRLPEMLNKNGSRGQ